MRTRFVRKIRVWLADSTEILSEKRARSAKMEKRQVRAGDATRPGGRREHHRDVRARAAPPASPSCQSRTGARKRTPGDGFGRRSGPTHARNASAGAHTSRARAG
jgi:hypothetical protein